MQSNSLYSLTIATLLLVFQFLQPHIVLTACEQNNRVMHVHLLELLKIHTVGADVICVIKSNNEGL